MFGFKQGCIVQENVSVVKIHIPRVTQCPLVNNCIKWKYSINSDYSISKVTLVAIECVNKA